MKRPAWSYSAMAQFTNCPRAYQKTRVTKEVVDTPGVEAQWGTRVHKELEEHLLNDAPLPEHVGFMADALARIKRAPAYFGEKKLTLDAEFQPVSWFDKGAWVRGILDVGVEKGTSAWVGDYKTGKRRPGSDQLMLAAAMVMHSNPRIERVSTSFIWIKEQGRTDTEVYTREQLPAIWQHFLPKVARLEAAFEQDKWPAKPSGLCGWCACTKAHCEFSKR